MQIIENPIKFLQSLDIQSLDKSVERVNLDEKPDISTLNEEQFYAYNRIKEIYQEFLQGEGPEMVVLNGAAGTGKTYLVTKIIHTLLNKDQDMKIACVGMTHKAVAVSRLMSPFLPPVNYKDYPDRDFKSLRKNLTKIRYSTAHSILALVPKQEDRKQVWVPHPVHGAEPPVSQFDSCFVDEASMEDTEIIKHFYKWSDETLIIHIGDVEQLPPPGEPDVSPLFKPAVQNKLGIEVINLTEVMRQAQNSPILAHATAIRLDKCVKQFKQSLLADDGNSFLAHLDVAKHPEETVDILWRLFDSKEFEEDSNFAKVITWRRDIEAKWNHLFRKMKYMDTHGINIDGTKILPIIVEGERIILRAPWVRDLLGIKEIVFPNSAELKVLEKPQLYTKQVGNAHIQYYRFLVEYEDPYKNESTRDYLEVVHEDFQDKLKAQTLYYDNASRKAYKAGDKKKGGQMWAIKVNIESMFADITYPYAGTAHRAQGSTYAYSVIAWYDGLDIKSSAFRAMNPGADKLFKSWAYTSCTRAKYGNIIITKNGKF